MYEYGKHTQIGIMDENMPIYQEIVCIRYIYIYTKNPLWNPASLQTPILNEEGPGPIRTPCEINYGYKIVLYIPPWINAMAPSKPSMTGPGKDFSCSPALVDWVGEGVLVLELLVVLPVAEGTVWEPIIGDVLAVAAISVMLLGPGFRLIGASEISLVSRLKTA